MATETEGKMISRGAMGFGAAAAGNRAGSGDSEVGEKSVDRGR